MNLRAIAIVGLTFLTGLVWTPQVWAQRTVLAAFGSVVAEAAKSTVEIYADGSRDKVALGAIVDADGHVLTKASELKGKEKIECKLPDGRKLAGQIVGLTKDLDLALIKIDAQGLPVVQWREGDAPPVGSWLATAGMQKYPVAVGVLSVGPRKISAAPAAMGVKLEERDDVAMIKEVMEGSPAEQAGIEAGDVILQVNDKKIENSRELMGTISKHQPGDKVKIVIKRGEDEKTFDVILGSRQVILAREFGGEEYDRADFQNHLGGELSERRAGFPSAIQHDTVLAPSDCGGPIVDLDGKVVGINIARAGRVESFALPASLVRGVLPDLLSGKLNPNPQADSVVDGTKPVTEEKKVQ